MTLPLFHRAKMFQYVLREELRNSAGKLLLQTFRPERAVTGNGKPMLIDLRDTAIANSIFTTGAFEQHVTGLIHSMNLSGAVALDIGANIGVHTLHMSESVGPDGAVFAFEPEPRVLRLLHRNLSRNAASNVTVIAKAAGAGRGIGAVQQNPNGNLGDNRVRTGADADGARIEIVPVDEVLRDVSPGRIRFVKIDVQGFEMNVLAGMSETIERNPDMVMLIEMDHNLLRLAGHSGPELARWLLDAGFEGFEFLHNRIAPLSQPESYELFQPGAYTDLLLSRNPDAVRHLLQKQYPALQKSAAE
jgi:FkbM family methyltransferase